MSRLSLGISRLSIPRLSDARRSFERISNYFHRKDTVQLKRELSLMSTVNLIVNGTIGSGIFVTPGIVLSHSGSTGMSLVIWSICGGISLLGALAFAELGMVIPRSGGQYAFYQAAFRDFHPFYGPITGFVYVWINVLVIYPSSLAILVLTFADYIYEPARLLFNADIHGQRERIVKQLIGFLALGIMAYINFVSVKLYVRVQNVFSYFKITVCVLIIFGGFYMTATGKSNKLYMGFNDADYSVKALIMAFYSGLYTFDGWCIVTGVTEEIKNPDKNILRSVLIAVPLVTLLYLCVNTAYLTALTVPQVILQPAVAVAFADNVYGQMKLVVSVGVAFSAFGTGLCTVFAASRPVVTLLHKNSYLTSKVKIINKFIDYPRSIKNLYSFNLLTMKININYLNIVIQ